MFLKLYFENKIHKISKIPETFPEFCEKTQEIFKNQLHLPSCSVQYEDDEGDRIVLAGEDDYKTMLTTETETPIKTIKIFLTPRRLSAEKLPLKKCLSNRSNSDNLKQHQKVYINSEDERKELNDKEEEKIAPPRKHFKSNKGVKFAEDVHKNDECPKKPFYCGYTLKSTKSRYGEQFEIPSQALVVVTKFFDQAGLAEIVHKDHKGIFPLSDLQIMNKARFFHSCNGIPTVETQTCCYQ